MEDEGTIYRRDVLDHGFIRLVDYMGSDLSVVRAARTSYDAAWRAGDDEGSDRRLINYLWKNNHSTPFEAATVTFEVKAPIFVFRQWHRHRTQAYNELSARYKELPEEFYVPSPEVIGLQSKNSKQARDLSGGVATEDQEAASEYIRVACEKAFQVYHLLLSQGTPRELARLVLPVGTYSHMFTTMNLLNAMKFLTLRTHPHAQWEIQQYARAMFDLLKPVFPVCMNVWDVTRA